jgi:hypothetical protein
MKMKRTIIILLTVILTVAGLGCAALSTLVTPSRLDKGAVNYAVDAGVAEPNEYAGYQNLYKAQRLQADVEEAHEYNLFELETAVNRENLDYAVHRDTTKHEVTLSKQREEILFGQNGLLTLGLTMAGFGGLTGYVGLMRKRPQDFTPDELNTIVEDTTGRTIAELQEKNKQLFQVVKGVGEFIKTYEAQDGHGVVKELKGIMDKVQDTKTKTAIAAIKKEV